jgi:3-deoxy-manno-octulosonate cytidylyltransferase (CMP-KDO synthetase)
VSTLIVIPARLGATRLPQKPLRLLGGQPLIVRVWERVAGMNIAERVVIATDSERVAAAARKAGAEVAVTRLDHASGTDRVAEVVLRPEFSRQDVIVNVQGDEPYISKAAVQGAAAFVEDGIYPLGTAAFVASPEVLGDPAVVKVVTDSQNRALYFSRAPIPFLRDGADAAQRNALVKQHLGVYAYTRAALARWVSLPRHPLELAEQLEQLRAVADGLAMGVATVEANEGGGIDTEEDLALANARWRETTPTPAGAH